MSYRTFETERLYLRPVNETDAAFILTLFNSPSWRANIGERNVHTVEEAENYIRVKMISQIERLGFGNYTLSLKANGNKIGVCGLFDRPNLEGIDLGYALLDDYTAQGYATEAAKCIMKAGLEDFHLDMLLAITKPSNKASQRVLEKIGFSFKKNILLDGDTDELMLFSTEKKL
ncbi:MAG: GNAT family N-acetyltransferase [Saprospiraceae bacterium]